MSQDKGEKKRKRAVENGDRPSKKVVVDAPSPMVKVSILPDPGDWAPVIASAPGLALPSIPSLKPYKRARPTPTTRPSSTGRTAISTSELLLHSSHHPKLDYTAREEESGGADSLLKHYIGVYDPTSGDLQVIEARNLVLRGTLRQTAPVNEPTKPEKEEDPPSRLSARTTLGLAFGTQKSKKAIRALTENAIPTTATAPTASSTSHPTHPTAPAPLDPIAAAVFASMSATTSPTASKASLQQAIDAQKPRPRPNLAATSPADVYRLQDLVGEDALRGLRVRDWQTKIAAGEDVKTGSRFVSARLVRVVQAGDVLRLKGLRYLLLLVEWFAALKGGGRAGRRVLRGEELAKAMGAWEEGLVAGVGTRFADGSVVNKWATDNLMTHICALALTIDNFEVDTSPLREDLRLENKEITQYFRELGCAVTPMTDTEMSKLKLSKAEGKARKVARLRLPLVFPQLVTTEEPSGAAVGAAVHEALMLPGAALVDLGVLVEAGGALEGAGAGGVRAAVSCWCGGPGDGDGGFGQRARGSIGGAGEGVERADGIGKDADVGVGVGEGVDWADGVGKDSGIGVGEGVAGMFVGFAGRNYVWVVMD